MSAEPPDLHARIADALSRLAALARAREQHEAMASGLSPLQARALVVLGRPGAVPLRVGDVAERAMVSYGTISAAITSLEEKGFVEKHVDPDEHRAVLVRLTRRGRSIARRADGWGAELFEAVVGELELPEASALLGVLLKLIAAFERRGDVALARLCLTCRHFQAGGGDAEQPHFCRLLERAIGGPDLRVDCPEHEPAAATDAARAWRALDPLA